MAHIWLQTQHRAGRNKKKWWAADKSVIPACTKRDHSQCLLFILLETESVGGGWWASGGAKNYNPPPKTKAVSPSLFVCLFGFGAIPFISPFSWLEWIKDCAAPVWTEILYLQWPYHQNMKDSEPRRLLDGTQELAIKTYKCSPL